MESNEEKKRPVQEEGKECEDDEKRESKIARLEEEGEKIRYDSGDDAKPPAAEARSEEVDRADGGSSSDSTSANVNDSSDEEEAHFLHKFDNVFIDDNVDAQPQHQQSASSPGINNEVDKDNPSARFMKRWHEQGDRKNMIHLLKNHDVSMYEFNGNLMECVLPPQDTSSLIGTYDILFVCGQGIGTDDPDAVGGETRRISRTVSTGGRLVIETRNTTQSDYYYPIVGTPVIYGKLHDVTNTYLINENIPYTWSTTLQMNLLEFRQPPPLHFEYPESYNFLVTDASDESSIEIRVVTNSGSFPWTPNDTLAAVAPPPTTRTSEDDIDDTAYKAFVRKLIEQRKADSKSNEGVCWLSSHMELPVEAACNILAFNRHKLPPMEWSWQKGDLLLRADMQEYATTWHTLYIARPRDEGMVDRLLPQL